jgi:hypothetical protein
LIQMLMGQFGEGAINKYVWFVVKR